MSSRERNTKLVKQTAHDLGFDFCGISKADFLDEDAPELEKWLKQGHHGQMHYMENHFDKRLDPRKLVPGAQSVVTLMYNYYPKTEQQFGGTKISKYAYGKDYHKIIKKKLKTFVQLLKEEIGDIDGRAFVDSAPVMERSWGRRSGLGWQGKHTLLINQKAGSFYFLAVLITDLDLQEDGPVQDHCGTCTRCLDACPTDAIYAPYKLDASKCISYLTIELKDQIPQEFQDKMEGWAFGCDICQDVCPWNRFSTPHQEPAFEPNEELLSMSEKDWEELTEETFTKVFAGSAVKRTKLEGLKRNMAFLKG